MGPVPSPPNTGTNINASPAQQKSISSRPDSARASQSDLGRAPFRHVYPRLQSTHPVSSEAEYLNQGDGEPSDVELQLQSVDAGGKTADTRL